MDKENKEDINNDSQIQEKDVSLNSFNSMNTTIIDQLIELGYNPKYSKRILQYYYPQNIEDALDYLYFENGIIQHRFIKENSECDNNICHLCGEEKKIHLNSDEINIINNINNNFINTDINGIDFDKDNNKSEKCSICDDLFCPNEMNNYLASIVSALIVGINIYLLKLKTINYYSLNALTMNAKKNLMKTLFLI